MSINTFSSVSLNTSVTTAADDEPKSRETHAMLSNQRKIVVQRDASVEEEEEEDFNPLSPSEPKSSNVVQLKDVEFFYKTDSKQSYEEFEYEKGEFKLDINDRKLYLQFKFYQEAINMVYLAINYSFF